MADPGQAAATGREADPVHPAAGAAAPELGHQLTERHLAAPEHAGWLLIHFFNVGRKHSSLKSQDPTASKTLLGCQSKLRTVERVGFLTCLLTYQSFSDSKYQTKMSHALLPMANLFSLDESGCMVSSQDHQG